MVFAGSQLSLTRTRQRPTKRIGYSGPQGEMHLAKTELGKVFTAMYNHVSVVCRRQVATFNTRPCSGVWFLDAGFGISTAHYS